MLPITKEQAQKAVHWMKKNYQHDMKQAVAGTAFSINHICGIGCQETAFLWLGWIDKLSPGEVLGRCIGDASGDFPGTVRNVFPRNTGAFEAKYDAAFSQMLIDEANKTRKLRGMSPRSWIYKGYGIYQYDLQSVTRDESFFRDKKWYHYSECLAHVMKELKTKYAVHKDIWKTIKAYNGSGPKASVYANNVVQFSQYSSEVNI